MVFSRSFINTRINYQNFFSTYFIIFKFSKMKLWLELPIPKLWDRSLFIIIIIIFIFRFQK